MGVFLALHKQALGAHVGRLLSYTVINWHVRSATNSRRQNQERDLPLGQPLLSLPVT